MTKGFRFKLKESFGLKVLYSFIVVIVIVLSAFTLFTVIREGEKTKNNLREQGEMLSTLLAESATVGIFAENETLLKDAAKGIMALKDVSAVSMYTARMKILYARDKKSSARESFAIMKDRVNRANADPLTIVEETENFFEFLRPVLIKSVSSADESLYFGHEAGDAPGKVTGYVRIVLSKDSYRKEILAVLERNAVIMAIFILSSIVIVYVAVKKLTGPLKKLTDNVNALGKGMSVEQIPVESRDEIGNLASAFNAMVVAREQAEKSLRESEKKFRTLAETAAAAIFIYRGASFCYLNSTTEKLTGYMRDDLLRMSFWDIVHPDYQSMIKELAEGSGQGNSGCFQCEFKIVTNMGEERWVDFTSGAIEFEGEPASLGTAYDVTESKKLEEQFRQAQKMEAVGMLAGGIAHDFNNILTAIMTYGYLAKKKKSHTDPLVFIDQIITCSERGANITHGLLAFSRKQIINAKPVKANEIITEINKLLPRIIGEDIDLKTKLADRDMTIMADAGQVEQIFMNLATNAKHAMPAGGSLIISTESIELDQEFIRTHGYGHRGAYALITVQDTGTGMDEKTQKRVFEPFFTTKDVGKGTGLGLSIVYGIVKQHKGYITVASKPGSGTSFNIYLPLVLSSPRKEEARRAVSTAGGTETVLVAEDNQEVRDNTIALLAESGYTVIEAFDGKQAVTKFIENKDRIRLLIFDVIMPGKNGKEAWKEILSIRPDIKVLFMTGYASDIFEKETIPERGFKIITKPISPSEFLEKVRIMLDE